MGLSLHVVSDTHVLYKPWWKRSRLQEKELMESPVAILFLLKNAPNCIHISKTFLGGGARPQTPLESAACVRGKLLHGKWASPTKRTTLKDFLDPPLPLADPGVLR